VAANARSRALPGTTSPIAVLDTGVDPTVPELAGRVLAVSNAITGTPPASADDDGHGTQVAAAAAGKPGLVAGISPTSPIMPIRVATASVLATPATIVKGLEIAATRKARVAVLPSSQLLSQVFADSVTSVGLAISAAFSAGVVTVVPAGNEGQNEQTFPGTLAHVLTVGSAASVAGRDEFSNFGPWLDLLAPGADLVLPAPPSLCLSGYARASGTSFAAGAVAGATALIAAARPRLTTSGLYDLVRRSASADITPSGFDANSGFGMLDVGKGLSVTAAAADPHEVDDNVYWLKRRPAAFPTYMRRTRVATVRGSVSPGKDPQDAVKVHLRRGDVLRVRVTNPSTAAVLYASIWSRATGDFDMRLPSPNTELRAAGFTQNPSVSYRATRTGTHYVAVFAPVWTVPGEQGTRGKDLAPLSPPRTAYRLTMTRRR
jgi:subtilisin family serine protease